MSLTNAELAASIQKEVTLAFGGSLEDYLRANLDAIVSRVLRRIIEDSLEQVVEGILSSDPSTKKFLTGLFSGR